MEYSSGIRDAQSGNKFKLGHYFRNWLLGTWGSSQSWERFGVEDHFGYPTEVTRKARGIHKSATYWPAEQALLLLLLLLLLLPLSLSL